MDYHGFFECSGCTNYSNMMKRLFFFQKISQNILSKQPLNKLLDEIIKSSKSLLNAEACSLLLNDGKEKSLYFHTISGSKKEELANLKIKYGQGIAGWVAKHKKVLKIDDCYSDPRFNKQFDIQTGFKTRNMLCAPMIRNKDLIGVIQIINKKGGSSFDQSDIDLFTALCSECALAIENARLVSLEVKNEQLNYELGVARDIQQKLLPSRLPSFRDIDIAVKLIPAKEIGGDYFNIVKISDNESLFFVADVSGKSISAALIVSTLYSFLQTYLIINKENFNLKNFVESLNRFVISSTTQDKFVTAWFGLYNHSQKELQSISAGHNPTYLLRQNGKGLIELLRGGLLLGSIDFPYDCEVIKILNGDLIIFYTDGITEAMNLESEEFGEERFINLIGKNNKTANGMLETILREVKLFTKNAEQSDDMTCGIIKIN